MQNSDWSAIDDVIRVMYTLLRTTKVYKFKMLVNKSLAKIKISVLVI